LCLAVLGPVSSVDAVRFGCALSLDGATQPQALETFDALLMLFTACLLLVRNQRILAAWNAREEDNARRAAPGLPPKTRKRRRATLASLAAAPP
jgi:hypothetical protein